MKKSAKLMALVALLPICLTSCSKINLTKPAGSKGSANGGSDHAPPLKGDWKITYIYNGEPHESEITFSQHGKALAGDGHDDTGVPFMVQSGTVDGGHVHFLKKYADNDPSKPVVEYNGDLSFEDAADYKGWSIGGHYKIATPDGKSIDDKWVAVDQAAAAAMPNAPPSDPQMAPPPDTTGSADQGQGPPNISGFYTATYESNFKSISTRLWLKQNGEKITGDGTDRTTGEYFTIDRGFYRYPKLVLVCHYNKGPHSKVTRDLIIKAAVNDGPCLRGETQHGSVWQANLVR